MTHAPTEPAISTRQLTKRYGRRTALDGIDLDVESGSVFGVIGPNGAGKTTTMRLLLDIIRPSSGQARVLGIDPRTGGAELRRQIGFLPGELKLDGRVRGGALLRHYAEISGAVAPGTIESMAERLDLDLARPVRSLSKGNKQKLGLVQAFMHRPRLLVLDEPSSGLDPLVQQEFLSMVREARDAGQTVFLSSHVLSEIQQVADAVAILRSGRLVTVSSVDRLRETAMRHVRVGVAPGTEDAVLATLRAIGGMDGLATTAEDDRIVVHATSTAEINTLVRALARHELLELVIEEPDLEESILRYYGTLDGAQS
jgi:ABC-2 type transport system ATP-binding protein